MTRRSPGGGRGRGPVAPKPYAFVSFVDKVLRREVPGHHTLNPELLTGVLTFHVQTVTPLFVSSGQAALSEDLGLQPGGVVQTHYRMGGRPAIPASSLKGMVRSVAEAVSASCLGVTRIRRRDLSNAFRRSCTRRAACPACTLFGMGGREAYLGQVRFEDALLQQEGRMMVYQLPALYRPRPGAPVYRDRNRRYKGRKFYKHGQPQQAERGGESEVIRSDSLLIGQVAFTNLTDDQLGLLFYALGLESCFLLKLGGGKPACLGSLLAEPVRLALRDGREAFLGSGETPAETIWEGNSLIAEVRRYIAGARQSGYILARQAEELERILRFDTDALTECPTGAY